MAQDSAAPAWALAGLALAAGLAGATAMLVSQTVEMRFTGREPSPIPARAVEKVLGFDVEDGSEAEQRLSTAMHFAFGTALGLGLLMLDRVPAPVRPALFTTGAWLVGTGNLMALGIAEPPTRWSGAALATDVAHHAAYGLLAAATYRRGKALLAARAWH